MTNDQLDLRDPRWNDDQHSLIDYENTEHADECPECGNETLRVTDGVYADCKACDASLLRNEVGL